MLQETLPIKPALRGYLHQETFFVALGAGILLIARISGRTALIASLIYCLCLLLLFGISAFYHRLHWQPNTRALLKRLDHSAIYLLIAGTFTPICLFALSDTTGPRLLLVVWSVASLGIMQTIFWVQAPKWFSALFYVAMGWLVLPYLTELRGSLGSFNLLLLAIGGMAYTLGALVYALKRPGLVPAIFGYHELFHLLTIIGAALHFIVIYHLVT